MPFAKTALAELGDTESHKAGFRSHMNLRNETGGQIHIYGPSCEMEDEAQLDLNQIRAAGGVGGTREESLRIMMA